MPPKKRWKNRTPAEEAAAQQAEAEIRSLRQSLDAAEAAVERARKTLAEGIARHVEGQVITQAEAARASQYETRTINRLIRSAGVAPFREPKAASGEE
ncbi:hypothetical protein [Streptomyces hydrogenans]|uniref:hypothetical protein n=1 Tax=Streptomyces hydrogenans TaxID=1873719 RepID=UPI003822D893